LIAVDRHGLAVLTSSTNLGNLMRFTEKKLKKLTLAASLFCAVLQLAACGGGGGGSGDSAGNTPPEVKRDEMVVPSRANYTVAVGSLGAWQHPTDTPAVPYIDKDGAFYFQQSAAEYGVTEPRNWEFYTGSNFDTAKVSTLLGNAVNPDNPLDKNNDTSWRCNNSPTGLTATFSPKADSRYSQKNYCDVSGVWVDPDTGYWYGLVHNEFSPEPFGDNLHYDAIDVAVSKNQGMVWAITDQAITSPYSTMRNDTKAFPHETYSYGDGDQRLFVDMKTGYFYAFYGSRILDKKGSWAAFYPHVARAPISGKMAAGTWSKWYDGKWSEPGVGGKESNMVPVDSTSTTGYTPVAREYDPMNPGTASEQIKSGTMPPTSPLFVMNITYNAYLGLYIGAPTALDQSGNSPQFLYATADLNSQKWYEIGDTGAYQNASWYRWFLDSANSTSSMIVGKSFRSYCSIACSNKSDSEYINLTIDSPMPAKAPFDLSKNYVIGNSLGRVLTQVAGSTKTTSTLAGGGSAQASWHIASNGDGSYLITNVDSGQALGVDSASNAGRAWGVMPTVAAKSASVGQQWLFIGDRLINRYSGLVLGMSSDVMRPVETTPYRNWENITGNSVGGTRNAAEQTVTFTVVN
jgi:hypothetical protein